MRYCRADHEHFKVLQAQWSPSTVRTRHEGRNGTEGAVATLTQQDEPIGIAYEWEQHTAYKGSIRSLHQLVMRPLD